MIDLEESSFNGWYAKKVINGCGEVECKKCGLKKMLTGGIEALNLKEHDCDKEKNNPS